MTEVSITLDKKVHIDFDKFVGKAYTVETAINFLNTISDLTLIISVTWQVYEGARTASGKIVSVEAQNARMLHKAQKIATGIGREVEAFDQVNNVTYGCVLI